MSCDISTYLVDWDSAKPYLMDGSFCDAIWKDYDNEICQSWVEVVGDDAGEEWNYHDNCWGELALLSKTLSRDRQKRSPAPIRNSLCRIVLDVEDKLVEQGITDIDGGGVIVAASPQMLVQEIKHFKSVDLDALKTLYSKYTHKDTQSMISEWGGFDEGLLPFFKQWTALFEQAVSEGKGIVVIAS